MGISSRVATRISNELKRYQDILADAKKRDVSESDTGVIIGDMLSDVFGYEKYLEVTTEFSVKSRYVDFAVKVENDVRFLVEVKAIGVELKDNHINQAVDYGANEGIEWVILTNGIRWRAYKIIFGQPIEKSLVFDIDVLACNVKSMDIIECLGCLSREAFSKDDMTTLYQQKQLTGKYSLASVMLGETMLNELRKELRRISPGLKVDVEQLETLLANEVIKRELIDSEEAKAAAAFIKKTQRSVAREKRQAEAEAETPTTPPTDQK